MRRVLSFMLALVMVLSLVPTAFAAENPLDGLTVNGLSVTQGETMTWNYEYDELVAPAPTGGSVEWEASGNQIIAVATPGEKAQAGAILTFVNTLETPATLRFEYTLTKEDDYAEFRDSDGKPVDKSFEMELQAGKSFVATVISPDCGYGSATLTISNLSLSTGADVTATFAPAENGSYTLGGEQVTGEISKDAPAGTKYAVAAEAASGYRFFGWYDGSEYISYKAETEITVNETCTIYPVFIKDTVAVFGVGEARFQSLNEADAYATNGVVKTIVLMNDGILSGEHTVSAGNTLLIPYDAANTVHTTATPTAIPSETGSGAWTNVDWEQPNAYRLLTMAADAKITVHGALNVGGKHSAGGFRTAGAPSHDLGMIQMAEGSNITIANGGVLHCWGYIYGAGTVTVKDGGTVHENFQFTDFRGGNFTLGVAQTGLAFPLSQYYVQNIEVAATFEQGATEYVWGSLFLGSNSQVYGTSVKFIGDNTLDEDGARVPCMFIPGAGGTVTKRYDPATDRLIIDTNGTGSINPMGLALAGNTIETEMFMLPINSNMTINVNSGVVTVNQSLALLPGSKLTIAEGARVVINEAEAPKKDDGTYVHYTGMNNLIVYDRDQWLKGYEPVINNGQLVGANVVDTYFVYSQSGRKRLEPAVWSPTRRYNRTEADLVDAIVDINGELVTNGFMYTTVDVDLPKFLGSGGQIVDITGGGAAVTSSRGTGHLIMNNGSGRDTITMQPIQASDTPNFAYLPMLSARLLNKDGSYTDTMGSEPGAVYEFCTACGEWYLSADNPHSVEITWIVDGVDGTQEVCAGTKPVYNGGTDPVKEGYKFIGWSTGNDNEFEYTSENLPEATTDATYYACFEEEAAQGGLLGDFDLNGVVESDDLTLLARHVGGIEPMTNADALQNADVTGDGNIDSDDLTKHARYVGGIINSWDEE